MNVAVVGCGIMGEMHARTANESGFRVIACGDIDDIAAQALAQSMGVESTADCASLIRRSDIDVVVVATPTHTHARYAVAAAQAGKHVFCEAPFARTEAECKEIEAAAKKAKVTVFVAHSVRFSLEFEGISAQISSGAAGKVGFLKTYRANELPSGANDWYADPAQSGGVVLDSLVHDFEWIAHAFDPIKRVFCQHIRREAPAPLEYALLTLTLQSGIIAQCIGSWALPEGHHVKTELCGDGGIIQYDSAEAPLHWRPNDGGPDLPDDNDNPAAH
ncbi:MAG: Gfo/Idh/MocA family oxidoreductase, partial [Candidatus Hydrogenedentales bacterium]